MGYLPKLYELPVGHGRHTACKPPNVRRFGCDWITVVGSVGLPSDGGQIGIHSLVRDEVDLTSIDVNAGAVLDAESTVRLGDVVGLERAVPHVIDRRDRT